MVRIISVVIVALFLSLSIACAVDFNDLQDYAVYYNDKIENAPGVLKSMIGNEKVDLTVLLNNGSTMRWGMELENAKIIWSGYSGLEKPTIEVKTTEDAINNVLHAEKPMTAYQEAEKSGQMTIDGKTFGSDAKITMALGMGSVIDSFIGSLI